MKTYVWILLLLCLAAAGCSKSHSSKQVALVNSEGLSVTEADNMLATPVEKAAPLSAPEAISPSANITSVAEGVVNSETVSSEKEEIDPKSIQQALKNLGLYAGEVDGKIGHKTKEAIMEFQKANKLTVDGKVGPKTWALLKNALETTSQPAVIQ